MSLKWQSLKKLYSCGGNDTFYVSVDPNESKTVTKPDEKLKNQLLKLQLDQHTNTNQNDIVKSEDGIKKEE